MILSEILVVEAEGLFYINNIEIKTILRNIWHTSKVVNGRYDGLKSDLNENLAKVGKLKASLKYKFWWIIKAYKNAFSTFQVALPILLVHIISNIALNGNNNLNGTESVGLTLILKLAAWHKTIESLQFATLNCSLYLPSDSLGPIEVLLYSLSWCLVLWAAGLSWPCWPQFCP